MIFQENSSIDARPLAWAVAGSLLLHLLLLWPAVSSRPTPQSSAILAAYLRPNKAEPAPATIPQPARPDVVRLPARLPPLPSTRNTIMEPVAEASSPAVAALGTTALVESATLEAIAPNDVGTATSAVAIERAAASSEGVDADGLRKFRLDLATQARRSKHYPAQALAAGWHGTAEIRLTVERGGIRREPELLRSSGFTLLDAAAVDMLARAAPQTAIPESLYGRTFSVVLPVVFDVTAE